MAREYKSEYKNTKMPWGKHKGKFVSELPEDYLIWAAKEWGDVAARTMFEVELLRRVSNKEVKL